jgi:RNA polymerase sigma factor (sigma-70 family)
LALAEDRAARRWAPPHTQDSDTLVVETVRRHAEQALGIARRHTKTPEDALDAYARALLKLVRHKARLRADTVHLWLFEVVRREAVDVCEQRRRLVAVEEGELHGLIYEHVESAEERVLALDVASRAGEALRALKTDEARALTLQAAGLSYLEIADRFGWSSRKTSRALSEGRSGFRRRYAELESGEVCARWTEIIASGRKAPAWERARLRAHLANCPGCHAAVRELDDTSSVLAVVLPVALAGASAADRDRLVARVVDALGRFGDALVGGLIERTTGAVLKLQALAEAASAAKLAAVAASAVAVTGGGVAAVREATEAHPSAPRPARAAPAPSLVRSERAAGAASAVVTTASSSARSSSLSAARAVRKQRRTPRAAAGEFGGSRSVPAKEPLTGATRLQDFEQTGTSASAGAAAFERPPAASGSGNDFGGGSARGAGREFGG